MAYNKDDLKKKALKVAKEHELFFIEDIVAMLPCSKPVFYKYKLNELDELKRIIEENKANVRKELMNKFRFSDNATLLLALFKLICTEGQREKLAMEYRKHSVDKETLKGFEINIIKSNGKQKDN
jgi:hypothetical protein